MEQDGAAVCVVKPAIAFEAAMKGDDRSSSLSCSARSKKQFLIRVTLDVNHVTRYYFSYDQIIQVRQNRGAIKRKSGQTVYKYCQADL